VAGIIGIPGRLQSVQAAGFVGIRNGSNLPLTQIGRQATPSRAGFESL
jgi:hypothetical protein